jgi:hypothetical protein
MVRVLQNVGIVVAVTVGYFASSKFWGYTTSADEFGGFIMGACLVALAKEFVNW